MPCLTYNKNHATPAEIVEHLQCRGLIIPDPESAEKKIALMGYTRLRMYLESRCERTERRPFIEGTTFRNILNIHEFDGRLRSVCQIAVSDFEILLRNSISEAISERHGSHPYNRRAVFTRGLLNPRRSDEIKKIFKERYKKTKNMLARDYRKTYASPKYPPIWYMKEILTFGDTARLFRALNPDLCFPIAQSFGMPSKGRFVPWISGLVDLRNACAHHDRLFNHTFPKEMLALGTDKGRIPARGVKGTKLAALLQCLDYVMDKRGSPVRIEETVRGLVEEYEEIDIAEIGF